MEEAQIIGLVIAYTQLVKGFFPKEVVPLVSVIIGLIITSMYEVSSGKTDVLPILLKGLLVGGAATGTYQVADNIINKKQK